MGCWHCACTCIAPANALRLHMYHACTCIVPAHALRLHMRSHGVPALNSSQEQRIQALNSLSGSTALHSAKDVNCLHVLNVVETRKMRCCRNAAGMLQACCRHAAGMLQACCMHAACMLRASSPDSGQQDRRNSMQMARPAEPSSAQRGSPLPGPGTLCCACLRLCERPAEFLAE
jgi:hypothetical protein